MLTIEKFRKAVKASKRVRLVKPAPGDNHILGVVETPPQVRTLRFHYGGSVGEHEEKRERYSVALPYVQFIVHATEYSSARFEISISLKPAKFGDTVFFPFLPNVDLQNFRILPFCDRQLVFAACDNIQLNTRSLTTTSAFKFVDDYWSTEFEQYEGGNRWTASVLLADTPLRTYRRWDELTRKKGVGIWDGVDLKKWKLPSKQLSPERVWKGTGKESGFEE